MNNATTTRIELGNNDSLVRNVTRNNDGTFTAVTFSQSKTFKTQKGAIEWLAKRISR